MKTFREFLSEAHIYSHADGYEYEIADHSNRLVTHRGRWAKNIKTGEMKKVTDSGKYSMQRFKKKRLAN